MRLDISDVEWLARTFPDLRYDPAVRIIAGDLAFCAAYDSSSGKVLIGEDSAGRRLSSFLRDAFSVKIDLDSADSNGWPRVYEIGRRYVDIAARQGVKVIDLHFYDTGACCLSIRRVPDRFLTIERFMDELVVPFFYRLSYVDRYGLDAAKRDLWGEYSHGDEGYLEYTDEILRLASVRPERNAPCPCGSGRKYKRCHLDEVASIRLERSDRGGGNLPVEP